MTTTTFLKRAWCKIEASDAGHQTHTEQLEEACWNGLLSEMLPELIARTASGKQLFLWHIWQGTSFLKVELSEMPPQLEQHVSIDATFFLQHVVYN